METRTEKVVKIPELGEDVIVKVTLIVDWSERRDTSIPYFSRQGTRVLVWDERNEPFNPIEEMMTGERYNKPHNWYKKWVPQALEALGFEWDDTNMLLAWRQRCGCTCPCSPGFVVCRNGTFMGAKEIRPMFLESYTSIHLTLEPAKSA